MLNTKIKPFKNIAFKENYFFEIKELDLINNWNIFFFFPNAFSFICPLELKEISKKINDLNKNNIKIYAISTDSHYVQKNWSTKNLKINNIIFISDSNHLISKNFNILNKKDGNCYRSTIIIDPNLIIRSIEIIDDSIGRSIIEIEKKVKMLKFTSLNKDKLCPYNWNNDHLSINVE